MADGDADAAAGALFDRLFAQLAPGFAIEPQNETHRAFLTELFVACSPLRGVLPEPVVLHQAAIRDAAYRRDHPDAMRRIVLADGQPIGRIMVDWTGGDAASLIDLAVSPDRQRKGVGAAMLDAFLAVADDRRQRATLQVQRDNPAVRLYARLGFAAVETDDFAPFIDMVRPARA